MTVPLVDTEGTVPPSVSPSGGVTNDMGRPFPAARKLTQQVTTVRPYRAYRLCPYCGRPCQGAACGEHRDLLRLDPNRSLSDHYVKEERSGHSHD